MIENFDVKALTVEVGGLTRGGDCMRASYFDIDPRRRRDRKRLWLSITKWIEPHGTWPWVFVSVISSWLMELIICITFRITPWRRIMLLITFLHCMSLQPSINTRRFLLPDVEDFLCIEIAEWAIELLMETLPSFTFYVPSLLKCLSCCKTKANTLEVGSIRTIWDLTVPKLSLKPFRKSITWLVCW